MNKETCLGARSLPVLCRLWSSKVKIPSRKLSKSQDVRSEPIDKIVKSSKLILSDCLGFEE